MDIGRPKAIGGITGSTITLTSGADRLAMRIDDASVAHGMTDLFPTTAYFGTFEVAAEKGGIQLVGMSDDAGTQGIQLIGIVGVTDPTDTTPGVLLMGAKKSGTTGTTLGAAETVLRVDNWSSTGLISVLGNGYTGINVSAPAKRLEIRDASAAQLRQSYSDTVYLDSQVDSTGQMTLTGAGTNPGLTITDKLALASSAIEVTGTSFTVTKSLHSITGDTTRSVVTINGGYTGMILVLRFSDGDVTLEDDGSGGNLRLAGNFTGTVNDCITLIYTGSVWVEICRSAN